MTTVVELKQERARLVGEARNILDTAEGANRDLEGQEVEMYDRLDTEITALTNRIQRQEEQEKRDREMAGRDDLPGGPAERIDDGEETLEDQFRALARGERKTVEISWGRGDVERAQRDLTKGTDTAGGHTVDQDFVGRLYEFLTERSAIRQTNVTVLTTGSGEPLLVPKVTAHGSASIVAEGGTIGESDPTFGQVELGAYKYGQLIQLSNELVTDTAVNLLDFVARDAGRGLGEASGAHFVTGDGSSKPTGVTQDTSLGVTAASTTAITADEIIDLYFAVIGPYRRNSYWMLNDSVLAAIRKLKDSNGQYLWEPSLRNGVPDRILSRPVVTDHNMAEAAVGEITVLFGDFSSYYIRDVGTMRFERSDHFAFDSDLVTFRSIMRTDGKLVDTTGAVKHLIQAAA